MKTDPAIICAMQMDTRRRSIIFAALAAAVACVQCTAALMAPENPKNSAIWNDNETSALVDYLLKHKSEMGDAGAFKPATWNAAAADIAKHHTLGPMKTGKMCKGKYGSVCILILHVLLLISRFSASTSLQSSCKSRGWIRTILEQ